jgi:diguanylate cyclase (GGDEF)-like protein
MRVLPLIALIAGIALIPASVGVALSQHSSKVAEQDRSLSVEADQHAGLLQAYFARARSIALVMSKNPTFADFYNEPGGRVVKLKRQGRTLNRANDALGYLETLYPDSIGEVCFIDLSGGENARVVRGTRAKPADLSPDEKQNPFFAPTITAPVGQVFQARPYVSPDTHEWVISNSTPLQIGGTKQAMIHYEVTIESFRRQAAADDEDGDYDVRIVDGHTGQVIIDGDTPQRIGAPLGTPLDKRWQPLVTTGGEGTTEIDGRRVAYRRVRGGDGNANDWVVAAVAKERTPSVLASVGPASIGMLLAGLVLIGIGLLTMRARHRELEIAALTDSLTGLGNRRALVAELEDAARRATAARPLALVLYDLDGFKGYNDAFGHPAGDELLARLAGKLSRALEGRGRAFRMGGDEFCVLSPLDDGAALAPIVAATLLALSEEGEGFAISASYGAVQLPAEVDDPTAALQVADARMYDSKESVRPSPGRQSRAVLMRALEECSPDLSRHLDDVAGLAVEAGLELGLSGERLEHLRQAAELHDVGKVAIPDSILNKPGPLDDDEWAFLRRHTLIGERILAAAPSLVPAARLVRASHERIDGGGYPDGLAGDEIPLGARVIAVCDAFDAMTSDRPYRPRMPVEEALDELGRCAGTQFDPAVVRAFAAVVSRRRSAVPAWR